MPWCHAQREQVWETLRLVSAVRSDGHSSILSVTTHAFSFWGCVCLERDKCTNQPRLRTSEESGGCIIALISLLTLSGRKKRNTLNREFIWSVWLLITPRWKCWCAAALRPSFSRADWFSQHFIPDTIFAQSGLPGLNVLPSAAD